jgi:hypothetical protein
MTGTPPFAGILEGRTQGNNDNNHQRYGNEGQIHDGEDPAEFPEGLIVF